MLIDSAYTTINVSLGPHRTYALNSLPIQSRNPNQLYMNELNIRQS